MTTDFLLSCMEENRRRASDAEDKRAFIAHLSIGAVALTSVAIAFVGFNPRVVPLTVLLILAGIYGILASLKLYEISQYHDARARKLRRRLDELHQDAHAEMVQKEAESEHRLRYPRLAKTRLNYIWLCVHAVAILLGICYTIICII
jgi:hypothetical protein